MFGGIFLVRFTDTGGRNTGRSSLAVCNEEAEKSNEGTRDQGCVGIHMTDGIIG